MKTVVTGGAGFIGSTLTRRLLDQGRRVVAVDDFSRGSLQNLRDLGIQAADVGLDSTDPAVDLRDYDQALDALQGAETVFHLAARIGSIDYLHGSNTNELAALQSNLVIDTNVFKACMACGVQKIVYASSTAVYPIHLQARDDVVLSEGMLEPFEGIEESTVNPEGGYGWAKFMGEIQLGWSEVDAGIARIFNVYGENQDLRNAVHAIPSLIMKAIRYPEEPFIVWGNGDQSRDFLYVSDCADALLELERMASTPPVFANIGSGKPITIRDIAEKVAWLSGKDIGIEYDSTRPVGPISRTADITKATKVLNWQPTTSLEEGLRRTYSWVVTRLKTSDAGG